LEEFDMAKTKDLNAAANKLKKNYKEVLKKAVQYATEEAKKDVYKKALSCLTEYYNNYDPNSYNRTDSLRNAFLPYSYIKQNDKYISSVVGIEYDYSRIDGLYHSGSEKYGATKNSEGHIIEYGSPDSFWVIDNYLDGVHPTTNGYPYAKNVSAMEYIAIIDPVSPTEKMDKFLDQYAKTFQNNVYSYLASYVMR
jgi:hypothetical protein